MLRNPVEILSVDQVSRPDFNKDSLENILDYYVFCEELKTFTQQHGHLGNPFLLGKQFLLERFKKMGGTSVAYVEAPTAPSTQFCLTLAMRLCQMHPQDEKGVKTHCYTYLMPTLANVDELQGRKLTEMVLTDNMDYGLIVDECIFFENQYFNKKAQAKVALTKSEIRRIKNHSAEAAAYFAAVKICSSNVMLNKVLQALINGLMWSIDYASFEETSLSSQSIRQAAFDNFHCFIEKLKEYHPQTYRTLMEKRGNWGTFQNVWNQLLKLSTLSLWDELVMRARCVRNLVSIKKYYKNFPFFEESHPDFFIFSCTRAHHAHEIYRAAVEANTLHLTTSYKKLKQQLFLFKQLNQTQLEEIFKQDAMDGELAKLWKYLSAIQKNQLIPILSHERLSFILRKQDKSQAELSQAMALLQQEIKVRGGEAAHSAAYQVLKQIDHSQRMATRKDFSLLTELAHRTVVGLRDPYNENNFVGYKKVASKLSQTPCGKKVSASARIFLGGLLLGGAIASCVLTGGFALIPGLIGLSGLFLAAQGSYQLHYWKRPPHYHTTVSAMSFLNTKLPLATHNDPEMSGVKKSSAFNMYSRSRYRRW